MTIKYALVFGRICSYVDGTVKKVPNQWVPGTIDVEWKDPHGITNRVAGEENFITGAHDELLAIVRAEQEKIDRDVLVVLNQSFLNPTPNERELVKLMVEDGIDLNQITPKRVHAILRGLQPYFDDYATLADAYLEYMH